MLPLTAITITIAYLAALGAARKVKFIFMLNGNGDGVDDDDDDDDMCANVNTQQTDTHTVTNVLSSGVYTHSHTHAHWRRKKSTLFWRHAAWRSACSPLGRAGSGSRELCTFFSSHNRTSHHRQRNSTRSRPPGRQSAKQRISQPSQASSGQLLYTNFLWLFGSLYRVLLFSVPLTLSADGSL